jgi:transposase
MLTRLRKYEEGGRDALIDRRAPKGRGRMVTAEIRGAVRLLAHQRPELHSEALAEELQATLGVKLGGSTIREVLSELGLSRLRGRPRGSPSQKFSAEEEETVTPLPLAGAELLQAVETEVGAVRQLTTKLGEYLEKLPAPEGEVLDDRTHRDEKGRFQGSYNTAKARTEPELGEKFATVERHREEKDLRAMRTANSSFESRHRKDLALTYLPIVVETARWSALSHWQGAYLDELVGFPYMPSTLDKYARELKLGGASETAREAVTTFWLEQEGLSGGAVVYIDASTKPVWTHHFTRSTKITGNGRVMPGMSTVWLNSGSGTPLVYRTFSGHASVPRQVSELLQQVESAIGEGTTERLVVLDRESHAVWLFKELDAGGWQYIVPLRSSVMGPRARFENLGEWQPYGTDGDTTREGWLWLNDSRAGEGPLRHRVVARKRHRTGKVAWYATNTTVEQFDATAVIDSYFARWPLQEHVFRAGNGRVGLNVHHGYGKKKVTNVTVVSTLDKLSGKLKRCETELEQTIVNRDALTTMYDDWVATEVDLREMREQVSAEMEQRVASENVVDAKLIECYTELARLQRWLDEARDELLRVVPKLDKAKERVHALEGRRMRLQLEQEKKRGHTRIFTVDTELDEIMTAYKMTFMNLAKRLMDTHMKEPMELDELIRAVMTLPGERVSSASMETIRIYRQARDSRVMTAVERACASFNELKLTRGPDEKPKQLRFELVDAPTPAVTNGSA